jgi:hypothetical protein
MVSVEAGPGKRPVVTGCLILRNEEAFVERCLRALSPLVDEIIVVDTGSTDRTVEIARSFGATVICTEWTEDFSYHRNQAIDLAHGMWIFMVDGDEELLPVDFAEARYHLEHSPLPEVILVQETLPGPYGLGMTMLQPRLFRKDTGIRYIHPIHEQLNVPSVGANLSPLHLVHHGYLDPELKLQKERRNLAIALKMGDHPHGLHTRARSAMSLSDWPQVLECTDKLLDADIGPMLMAETCFLGAVAAYETKNEAAFNKFVSKGREVAPHSPDLRFMEFLAAGQTYLAALNFEGAASNPALFLRPYMMRHDHQQAQWVVDVLTGNKRIAEERPPAHAAGDANMAVLLNEGN